jgi:hypothetical protein
MALICSKCESHYLIEDYDQRLHYVTGYHCGMCGSTKIIEQKTEDRQQTAPSGLTDLSLTSDSPAQRDDLSSVISKEVPMSHPICHIEGCKKMVVKSHLCRRHYTQTHGVVHKSVPSTKRPPLTPGEIVRGKICAIEGCGRRKLAEGVCYKHLTEKHGGVNPYKYPKKVQKVLASCTRKVESRPLPIPDSPSDADLARLKRPSWDWPSHPVISSEASYRSPSGPRAELAQEIYELSDGNGRKATIAFSYLDGKKEFAECRMDPPYRDGMKGTFDDWMFIGSVALEIKRLAGV